MSESCTTDLNTNQFKAKQNKNSAADCIVGRDKVIGWVTRVKSQ